jgi:hypothetical protein
VYYSTCLQKRAPDPHKVLTSISPPDEDENAYPVIVLARRLLSICPNSASCERLFSHFGLILTKLRTKLSSKKLIDLAEMKLHLRDEHLRTGESKSVRRRTFGVMEEHTLNVKEIEGSMPPGTQLRGE